MDNNFNEQIDWSIDLIQELKQHHPGGTISVQKKIIGGLIQGDSTDVNSKQPIIQTSQAALMAG